MTMSERLTPEQQAKAVEALKRHAEAFVDHGLRAYSGYFPNDFYGKEGGRYYKWAQRAYDLITALHGSTR